jgi:hypothetical protein
MSDWQSIETAPSSGEVWCFWKTCGQQQVAERFNGEWFDNDGNQLSEPSHWMPLPEPPK